MLQINKNVENGEAVFALEGRLDTITAPELDRALEASLDGVHALTLDFAGVDYISSAGLRILLTAQKRMARQGEMTLIHVGVPVMEIFEVTGFSDILTIR